MEMFQSKGYPVGRVFANGPGDLGSIPVRVIPKTFKMVLDTSLLNTQQYKVRINVDRSIFKLVRVYFFTHNHHHHVVPIAQISLTLSRHFSRSFIASGRSSGLQPVSSHSSNIHTA